MVVYVRNANFADLKFYDFLNASVRCVSIPAAQSQPQKVVLFQLPDDTRLKVPIRKYTPNPQGNLI